MFTPEVSAVFEDLRSIVGILSGAVIFATLFSWNQARVIRTTKKYREFLGKNYVPNKIAIGKLWVNRTLKKDYQNTFQLRKEFTIPIESRIFIFDGKRYLLSQEQKPYVQSGKVQLVLNSFNDESGNYSFDKPELRLQIDPLSNTTSYSVKDTKFVYEKLLTENEIKYINFWNRRNFSFEKVMPNLSISLRDTIVDRRTRRVNKYESLSNTSKPRVVSFDEPGTYFREGVYSVIIAKTNMRKNKYIRMITPEWDDLDLTELPKRVSDAIQNHPYQEDRLTILKRQENFSLPEKFKKVVIFINKDKERFKKIEKFLEERDIEYRYQRMFDLNGVKLRAKFRCTWYEGGQLHTWRNYASDDKDKIVVEDTAEFEQIEQKKDIV